MESSKNKFPGSRTLEISFLPRNIAEYTYEFASSSSAQKL